MGMASRNVPGGPLILLALIVVPIVWLFATQTKTSDAVKQSQDVALATQTANGVVGAWYDDLGSKDFMDASMTIVVEDGQYYLDRKNGDGSSGRYRLTRDGNAFIKNGDKFGARYVVTRAGLELHDKQGFIRMARSAN